MIKSYITVEWSWLVVIFWYLVYTTSVVISTGQRGGRYSLVLVLSCNLCAYKSVLFRERTVDRYSDHRTRVCAT